MQIKKIIIENYRNFNSIEISFDETCNFIVGENNLGKSNILNLLNIIFTKRAFGIDDFSDKTIPINIELQLKLSDEEIGHFEDLFDLDDYSIINIICKQLSPDDNIEFFHKETDTYISHPSIRSINYIFYDSLRNPISEINFDKGRGVGKFLTRIVKKYLIDENLNVDNLLDSSKIDDLLSNINLKLSKIKAIKDFNLSAIIEDNTEELIPKLISLKDEKRNDLTKSGYGVQFLLLITLSILDKLQFILNQRGEKGIFENEENGEKAISLIIGLDEPEIHLHPYMQHSLIKYLNKIIKNEDSDFHLLIKELFGIDKFIGQIIIATHSPNIILNDYKQIIRLFEHENKTKIISGCNLSLGEQLEKHLFLHFPFIKEAFFSRCAIFVEGDSEYGSFPFFGAKLGVDFDDLGISVIQAGGDSIIQLIELAEKFGIPCVGINDSDGNTEPSEKDNLLKTNKYDFEDELMFLIDEDKEDTLQKILIAYDSLGENRELDSKAINKRAYKKYKYLTNPIDIKLKLSEIERSNIIHLKSYYSTWFSINKSQPLGRLIGMILEKSEIPQIYKDVIMKAKSLC